MAESVIFPENDWDDLLRRIKADKITPFLGAGACIGLLPTGAELARLLAEHYKYPMQDLDNLIQVAQYAAIIQSPMSPKEYILEQCFQKINYEEKTTSQIPHWALARLPLSIYITTNYDNFMFEALKRQPDKKPLRELCRWKPEFDDEPSAFDDLSYVPSPKQPLVFHLHGIDTHPESLVLTEDDYIDFLVNIASPSRSINASENKHPLPPVIQRAMARSSLLFLGYRLADINFRVLFQAILKKVDRSSVRQSFTLQFPKPASNLEIEYFEKYFANMKIGVAWGNVDDFMTQLVQRLEDSNHAS
jgi:hypothetical protein